LIADFVVDAQLKSVGLLPVFIAEQNLVGISAVIVMFYRHLGIRMTRHIVIMWKYDVIHQTGSTQRIATPLEEERVTATGNMQKKNRSSAARSLSYVSGLTGTQTDAQTNKQTYTHHNTSQPCQAEVTTSHMKTYKSWLTPTDRATRSVRHRAVHKAGRWV